MAEPATVNNYAQTTGQLQWQSIANTAGSTLVNYGYDNDQRCNSVDDGNTCRKAYLYFDDGTLNQATTTFYHIAAPPQLPELSIPQKRQPQAINAEFAARDAAVVAIAAAADELHL